MCSVFKFAKKKREKNEDFWDEMCIMGGCAFRLNLRKEMVRWVCNDVYCPWVESTPL